jgi:hypothetical protein
MDERLALAGKLLFVLTIGACAMFAPAMFDKGLDLTFTWLWKWGL